MLFDLRGRGRRRTVQVIYLTLAILMGGGLVLFGIGGATSGGLVDAITGGNNTSSSDTFQKAADAANKTIATQPNNVNAWRDLARAEYQLSGDGDNYDDATQTFTASGKAQLRKADVAWQRYLTLIGENGTADPTLASQMVQAYSQPALNEPAKAVTAIEYAIDAQPQSAGLYAQLAIAAYQAGQIRKGDLSAEKALSLTTEAQRATLKASLDQAKASAAGATTGGTDGAVTSTTG